VDLNGPLLASDVSGTVKSTSTRSRHTTRTSRKTGSQRMFDGSKLERFQPLTSYARAFLASHSRWQATGRALRTLEEPFSLKSLGLLKNDNLAYCYLRMSLDSYLTTKDEHSRQFSGSWMRWGMMRNGRCLTANISGSHKAGNGSSLWDILEESPSEKYFLSEAMVKHLLEGRRNQNPQVLELSPQGHIREVSIQR